MGGEQSQEAVAGEGADAGVLDQNRRGSESEDESSQANGHREPLLARHAPRTQSQSQVQSHVGGDHLGHSNLPREETAIQDAARLQRAVADSGDQRSDERVLLALKQEPVPSVLLVR